MTAGRTASVLLCSALLVGCITQEEVDPFSKAPPKGVEPRIAPVGAPVKPLPAGVKAVVEIDGRVRLDASGLVAEMIRSWKSIADYTCDLEKREWLRGRLEPTPHEVLERVRVSPLAIHVKWVGTVNKGRQAIWAAGQNDNKLLVHPNPIFLDLGGTWRVDPDNPLTRTQSNYDIREGGLQGIMAGLPHSLRPAGTVWTYDGESTVFGRPAWRISGVDPGSDGVKLHVFLELYIDSETLLPMAFVGRNREGRINVQVSLKNVRTNVGLTDADFDPAKLF